MRNYLYLGLVLTIFLAIALSGCGSSSSSTPTPTPAVTVTPTPTSTPAPKNVAFIYATGDITGAQSFETILEPLYPTDTIDIGTITDTTNFAKYSLIIIGEGCDTSTPCGASTVADKIKSADLPVIGICNGGLSYWGETTAISCSKGSANITDADVVNTALTVWSTPNVLDISGGAVTIYDSGTTAEVLLQSSLSNPGLTHIASITFSSTYDTITEYTNPSDSSDHSLYWAYQSILASGFNANGKKLFVNVVQYMMQ